MEECCPNCGHRLVPHRTDRQAVGRQEVILRWQICPRCHHIALSSWAYTEPTAEETERYELVVRGSRQLQGRR